MNEITPETCGYALTDDDGEQYPCDRPATGWRWYQDVGEHEDMLDAACDHHENEGGALIAASRTAWAEVERLAASLDDSTQRLGMALDMHQVQYERANRLEAERDEVLAAAQEQAYAQESDAEAEIERLTKGIADTVDSLTRWNGEDGSLVVAANIRHLSALLGGGQ